MERCNEGVGRVKTARPNRLLAVEPWWGAAAGQRRPGAERACAQLQLKLLN